MYQAPPPPFGLITFPGAFVHVLARFTLCRLFAVPIYRVRFLQCDDPTSMISHRLPSSKFLLAFLVVVPCLASLGVGGAAFVAAFKLLSVNEVVGGVMVWVAASVAMYGIPSLGEADTILGAGSNAGPTAPLFYLLTPVGGAMWLLAQSRRHILLQAGVAMALGLGLATLWGWES